MATKITRDVLEAYLNCKTKAHLKLAGRQGMKSDYEGLLTATRQEVRQTAIANILAQHPEGDVVRDIPLTAVALRAGPSFILDAVLEDDPLAINFDGLKKVDGPSKLGDFYYIPALFLESRKIRKEHRVLLEVYGVLLSRVQGRAPGYGIIYHGPDIRSTRLRLGVDGRKAERVLEETRRLRAPQSPPKLVLNDHCPICEFREPCHDRAIQEDNLSLLRGMGEREIARYNMKGIFTVTQLSYTFRSRRRGKRVKCEPTAHRLARGVFLPPPHHPPECLWEPPAAAWSGVG